MKRFSPPRSSIARKRQGAILIIAMVALLLSSALCTAMLKTALAERRLTQREQQRMQSVWLAESGVERAAASLASNARYQGETWSVPAKELDGTHSARIVIAVANDPEHAGHRRVTVTANFPEKQPHRVRITKTIPIGDAGSSRPSD